MAALNVMLGSCYVGLAVLYFFFSRYDSITAGNAINVDNFTCSAASFTDRAKTSFLHSLTIGQRNKSLVPIKLGMMDSPFVPNLKVSGSLSTMKDAQPLTLSPKKAVVVGTIRMGFGHHRIAYAASSWALAQSDVTTVFHDLLAVHSEESSLIDATEVIYSKGSRLASEIGGPAEWVWGALTKSGDANALRSTNQMAEHIRPLLLGLPKDTPIIATHSLVGHTAVAAGFKHVINLVIDNYPQWFIIAPGAINLVQGPTNYAHFLKMGVPPEHLRLAGHWIPRDLVENIDEDCKVRKERLEAGKPLRLLIPVGGAGAQKHFVTNLLIALKEDIRQGTVQVMLNAGDHKHMKTAFEEALATMGIKSGEYTVVKDIEGVHSFIDTARAGGEAAHGATLFAFNDYFPAVAATDLLSRIADVLVCKPSELAFYPVPKLMIRRVGDHEAHSAVRAAELGDGTPEVREVGEAAEWVRLMREKGGMLATFNDQIVANNKQAVYDGCKEAVRLAMELAAGELE
eukprot:CAMPEP_0181290506 /NCGR_PEP_ID=MMETSP1101-20121128/1450_1 /TAXON_ID=46948 /ORGANISM="Rhodomonas abbreviata, Strain Caron Lab Isolate" /LENGTH=513 /DNA_ID=CAMNT_0023394795 /DNA_START=320 /DNA_END=1861 /DNA_ORIENTATION=+